MMRNVLKVIALGLLALLAACGTSGHAHTTSDETHEVVRVTTDTAYTGIEGNGQHTDLKFALPTIAVCEKDDRTGVVPLEDSVDEQAVEAFWNVSYDAVVFVPTEEVKLIGSDKDLPICSIADDPEDMADHPLHGQHVHNGGQ